MYVSPEADEPSGPSPGLPYISDYDSDSDSDSDDESTTQFLDLPEDDDDIPPAPRYNLRSKSINATVLNAVATTIKQHQLEINPDIIPPLIVKPIARLTKGYGRANELLQLSHWAWSRLSKTDSFYANAIIDEETGKSLEYRQIIKIDKYKKIWVHSYANKLGRLAQGIRNIPGINTIKFIRKDQVPKGRNVTYGWIVVTYRPQKSEPNRSRLTSGGDRLDSPVNTTPPTADLTSIKLLWNSVISTPGSRYVTMDVKNFYLNTPLDYYQYMRLQMKLILQ